MAETYDVLVKVVSQEGTCGAGHKVGDEFVLTTTTPAGICVSALNSIFPAARVLRYGGSHSWQSDPEVVEAVACSDAKNPVWFELRRIRK